ncbi:twin-arginine translocase subunit TatC [Spirosoma utsteinense]|uniref:Sec-independent protein translocase protein TatC n=1 Tax=Spirosoma utsteinense TaxID=2585773 RepID=A0ABR6W7B1_9BACT|nr:twin-arginine translocase subunit TatC [Spirosoma utsteinense]MBC3784912.1 sec-independent protein translocase protein TatC [Spirosoma utsteinense]MBC3792473.1 sec-independent protein translocase protein TatC [Spirosoma utsteinense]
MPLDQLTDEEIDQEGNEMSFLDHLEELRWHIIRAVGSIFLFAIIAFIFIEDIFRVVILGPKNPDFWTYRMMCKLADTTGYADLCVKKLNFELQSLGVSDQFTMAMTSSAIIGLCFAFPYAFWEVWRFIKPGLRNVEKQAARGAVFFVSLLFLLGLLFGYYIVSPLAINFLANFQITPEIKNQFDITSYIGILVTLSLGCALIFQMPMVAYVLSKVGVLTPKFMREYRKHAWIVILVVAGIITPSPDIYSQVLVALPLTLLYEVSILVSARIERARLKAQRELMQS